MEKTNPVEEKIVMLINAFISIESIDYKRFVDLFDELSFKVPADRERELADAFLRIAKDDIRAARALYQSDLYPQSVYHLGQAVEKEMKAYLLYIGKLNFYDFCVERKDGRDHATTRILVRVVRSIIDKIDKAYRDLFNVPAIPKDEKRKFDKAFTDIDNLEKGRVVYDLDDNLKRFLEKSVYILQNAPSDEDVMRIVNMVIWEANLSEEYRKMVESGKIDVLEISSLVLKIVPLLVGLYMLSALTFPHQSFTRYPRCNEKNIPQPWEYTPHRFRFVKEEMFLLYVAEQYLLAIEDLTRKIEEVM